MERPTTLAEAGEAAKLWIGADPAPPPEALLGDATTVTVALRSEGCIGDMTEAECTSEEQIEAAALGGWIAERIFEIPGWTAGDTMSCEGECCAFSTSDPEEAGMMPHEIFELTRACFRMDGPSFRGLAALHFTEH